MARTAKRKEKDKRQDTGGGISMPNQPKTTKTEEESRPAPTGTEGSSDGDSSSRIIEFLDDNLDNDTTNHVFSGWEQREVLFQWKVTDDDVRLDLIELIKVDDPENPIRHASFDGGMSKQPDTRAVDSDFFERLGDSSTYLKLGAFTDDTMDLDYDDIYAVRMSWTRDGESGTGRSISPYFAVTDGKNDEDATRLQDQILANYDDAETGTEVDPSDNSGDPDSAQPNGKYPTGSSETDAADADADDDDVDNSSSGGGGGGGGLSPGTIAGIVVGIVVFLALIGGLVFFLLRRRKRKATAAGGYAQRGNVDTSNAYIVDKVDTSAQSPRSPYSDDGQEQHTPLDPQAHHNFHSTEHAAGEGSNGSEYAGLYQAANQHPQESTRGMDGDGAQSPRGAPSRTDTGNYSHLVEEGMTADDIRRLEEEERQLDDEIAQRAGRR